MNDSVIHLGWAQMASAYIFLFILLLLVSRRRINREREIAFASFRMTIQLILVGFALEYVFDNPHWLVTIGIFATMEWFAVRNVYARVKQNLGGNLRRVIAVAMVTGSAVSLLYFLLVVVRLDPWYAPHYFIPLGGMIIGNSMTGIAIGTERLVSDMKAKASLIEGALMLGATAKAASNTVVNDAFAAAIMPTINSMMGMGIVFLPGMMTGQILSGTSPTTAIQYQIAIMLGIMGSVSLTVYLLVFLGYRTFFNESVQLVSGSR